jgi:hypothetical protein
MRTVLAVKYVRMLDAGLPLDASMRRDIEQMIREKDEIAVHEFTVRRRLDVSQPIPNATPANDNALPPK